jgi:hypothetical protein
VVEAEARVEADQERGGGEQRRRDPARPERVDHLPGDYETKQANGIWTGERS